MSRHPSTAPLLTCKAICRMSTHANDQAHVNALLSLEAQINPSSRYLHRKRSAACQGAETTLMLSRLA